LNRGKIMWVGYCERIMGTPIAWLIKEYDRLVTNSPMAIETLYDMAACANTFNDWRNVLYRSEPGSIFERTALLQMAIYAKTFGAWLSVYQESLKREDCKDVQATALDQLQKLAVYPQDATWTKSKDALTSQDGGGFLRLFARTMNSTLSEYLSAGCPSKLMKEKEKGWKANQKTNLRQKYSLLRGKVKAPFFYCNKFFLRSFL